MTEKDAIGYLECMEDWNKDDAWLCISDMEKFVECCTKALKEIQQYRAIGTVEECREAVEKQRARKPEYYGDSEDGRILCPNCQEDLRDFEECGFNNCPYCGQAIDWGDADVQEP